MNSRFGVKDFVVLVLLLAIGASVWLSMVQKDRVWTRLDAIDQALGDLERHVARVEEKLEAAGGSPVGLSSAHATAGDGAATSRDGAAPPWALPDIPIAWQEPLAFASDPRTKQGFAPGGEFTEIFEGQPAKIVPYLSTDVYGRRVIDRVCETLGYFDPLTLEMRGLLADAWQLDPKGRFLRVHINPRARFSDGSPVTAADVKWTFDKFIMNPQIEAERQRSTLDMIAEVKVRNPDDPRTAGFDDRTVEFVFSEPIFTNLSYTMGIYVLPAHFYSKFDAATINKSTGLLMGSGQFKLAALDPDQQWAPGQDIKLVRNDQYWGIKPALDGLRFKTVTDDLARLTAFGKGEGDMIMPSSVQLRRVPKQADFGEKAEALEWLNMRSGYAFIAWQCGLRNGQPTPFADKRVRQAMTLLLDREKVVREIYEGVGRVATGPGNTESLVLDRSIKPWPYDLKRAKELLAEAGWKDRDGTGVLRNEAGQPFVFEFTRPVGGETTERFTNYIKDQCAAVGIECRVRPLDWSVFQQVLKTRDFDSLIMGWSPNSPESDPRQAFHSQAILDQGDNFVQWANPEADRLIDAGRHEMDFQKRMEIWHRLHALLHEEQPYTFVREVPWYRFVRKEIGNVHPYKSGLEPWEFFRIGPGVPGPG
ncbi:MAG: ABC transporter substrate-binding protein [Phycisphaerales bacterium]